MKLNFLIFSFLICSCTTVEKTQETAANNHQQITSKIEIPDIATGVYYNPELIKSLKSVAVDVLPLNGKNFVIKAQASRNFMPTVTSKSNPAMGKVDRSLRSFIEFIRYPRRIDSGEFDIYKPFTFKKQYMILGDSVWVADIVQNKEIEYGHLSFGHGPNWEPDSFVEVILEFEFAGEKKYIIDRAIPIVKNE